MTDTDTTMSPKVVQIPTGYLRISITDSCNMNCVYCHNEGQTSTRGHFMTLDEFKYVIVNARRFGLRKVRITGGEPLLHNRCIDMLRFAKREAEVPIVGFNTNATMRHRLLAIVQERLIDDLIVGCDSVDGPISKQSLVGIPSQAVLDTILAAQQLGQKVGIACVFDDNVATVEKLIAWCLKHRVTLKILQVIDATVATEDNPEFAALADRVFERFGLVRQFLASVGDYCGLAADGTKVYFFHSHCRRRECRHCGAIHMRVTSDGFVKTCIQEEVQYPLLSGPFDANLRKAIANVGHAPETRLGTVQISGGQR